MSIAEDFDPSINVEGGSIDLSDSAVVDAANRYIANITSKACVTPYIALEKIRKILSYYKVFLPQTAFLEGDEGNEVFDVSQFGEKYGMTNDGVVKEKNDDGMYVYFEWMMNDEGLFEVFCEIVNAEELDEILADFEEEAEDDESEDSDGAEPSHDMYKAANMNEDAAEEARQKRLAKWVKKEPKPKKKGKMAELMAGFPDEVRKMRELRKKWESEKK